MGVERVKDRDVHSKIYLVGHLRTRDASGRTGREEYKDLTVGAARKPAAAAADVAQHPPKAHPTKGIQGHSTVVFFSFSV